MSSGSTVAAVVLAAGRSTRFGGSTPKQLFEIDGKTLVERAIDLAHDASYDPVVVVAGEHHERVAAAVGASAAVAHNTHAAHGQSTSIRVGTDAIQDTEAVGSLFLPIDLLRLNTETLQRLRRDFLESPDCVLVPTARGKRRAPVTFPRAFFPMLRELEGDAGGRQLFKRFEGSIREVTVEPPEVLDDFDTREQVVALLRESSGAAQEQESRSRYR